MTFATSMPEFVPIQCGFVLIYRTSARNGVGRAANEDHAAWCRWFTTPSIVITILRRAIHHAPSPRHGPVDGVDAFDAGRFAEDRLVMAVELPDVEEAGDGEAGGEEQPHPGG